MEAAGGGSAMYDAERLLSEIKRAPVSDAEVLATLQQRAAGPEPNLAERVERERQEANQLHYDDVLRHAQRLLRSSGRPRPPSPLRRRAGRRVPGSLTQQLDLALLSCTRRRTFAGDPLQGIYAWAGLACGRRGSHSRKLRGPNQTA